MKSGAHARKKPGEYLFALAVLAVFAFAAWWTVTTLFAVELHQTGQWLQTKFEALRK
ncbi:MAG TPA: hypothetical protein VGQ93_05360 [Lysobacter sp.]|jgi:hypothetical protein|nr:hypothetical protein [Lysobacter sp.]